MKGSRLADVLDDKVFNRKVWETIFNKMSVLAVNIEKSKGPSMSIDDKEYRWVTDRLEYWNSEERLLSKDEMETANSLYRKYNN